MKRRTLYVRMLVATMLWCLLSLLGACSPAIVVDTSIYQGGHYESVMDIGVPESVLLMAGGPAQIEQQLKAAVEETRQEGAKIEWRRERRSDGVAYIVEQKGRMGVVPSEMGSLVPTNYNGQDAYVYEMDARELRNLSDMVLLRLHAQEILETNGEVIEEGIVAWRNPSESPYAIIVPLPRTNWEYLGITVVVAALFVAAAFVFVRTRQQSRVLAIDIDEYRRTQSSPQTEISPSLDESLALDGPPCPVCGSAVPSVASFCPKCGSPIQVEQAAVNMDERFSELKSKAPSKPEYFDSEDSGNEKSNNQR